MGKNGKTKPFSNISTNPKKSKINLEKLQLKIISQSKKALRFEGRVFRDKNEHNIGGKLWIQKEDLQ